MCEFVCVFWSPSLSLSLTRSHLLFLPRILSLVCSLYWRETITGMQDGVSDNCSALWVEHARPRHAPSVQRGHVIVSRCIHVYACIAHLFMSETRSSWMCTLYDTFMICLVSATRPSNCFFMYTCICAYSASFLSSSFSYTGRHCYTHTSMCVFWFWEGV